MSGLYPLAAISRSSLAHVSEVAAALPPHALAVWQDRGSLLQLWMPLERETTPPGEVAGPPRRLQATPRILQDPALAVSVLRLGAYAGGMRQAMAWRAGFPLRPGLLPPESSRQVAALILDSCKHLGRLRHQRNVAPLLVVRRLRHALATLELAAAYGAACAPPEAPALMEDAVLAAPDVFHAECARVLRRLRQLGGHPPPGNGETGDLLQGHAQRRQPTMRSAAALLLREFVATQGALRRRQGDAVAGAAVLAQLLRERFAVPGAWVHPRAAAEPSRATQRLEDSRAVVPAGAEDDEYLL